MQFTRDAYGFRWARGLGVGLGICTVVMLLGVAGMVWGVSLASESWWILPVGALPLLLAAAFLAFFSRRLPNAFSAVQADGLRVFFPVSLDTTIPFAEIESASLVRHHAIAGLGIRTNLGGHVALATAWGLSAELTLRTPVRTAILPAIWWTHARQLRLTVERPEEFVAEVTAALKRNQRGDE